MWLVVSSFLLGATLQPTAKAVHRKWKELKAKREPENVVSRSSLYVAALRHLSGVCPDPLAGFLSESEIPGVKATFNERGRIGQCCSFVRRPLWFDRRIKEAIKENPGLRQVVLLGAGLDARAYYIEALADCTVYEVDDAGVLDYKAQKMAAHKQEVPPLLARKVVAVKARLEDAGWAGKLEAAGFDPKEPVAWVLEGLSYYMTEADFRALLEAMLSLSAPGSRIFADVISQLPSPKVDRGKSTMAGMLNSMKFSTSQPEEWFGSVSGLRDVKVTVSGTPEGGQELHPGMDTDPNWMHGTFMSQAWRVPRNVDVDSYGRQVFRAFWVQATVA